MKKRERERRGGIHPVGVESRRRPESYVSRIWKGPGFLPGIIENRCRLSLYVDRRFPTCGAVERRGYGERGRGRELSPRTTAFTTARDSSASTFLIATPPPVKRPLYHASTTSAVTFIPPRFPCPSPPTLSIHTRLAAAWAACRCPPPLL